MPSSSGQSESGKGVDDTERSELSMKFQREEQMALSLVWVRAFSEISITDTSKHAIFRGVLAHNN